MTNMFWVAAVAVVGFSWWVVNGEQKWLVRLQDFWLSRFPADVEVTWEQRSKSAWRYSADGKVIHPHCLGRVLVCAVCCSFWVALVVSVAVAVLAGDGWWLLLPWVTAGISSR